MKRIFTLITFIFTMLLIMSCGGSSELPPTEPSLSDIVGIYTIEGVWHSVTVYEDGRPDEECGGELYFRIRVGTRYVYMDVCRPFYPSYWEGHPAHVRSADYNGEVLRMTAYWDEQYYHMKCGLDIRKTMLELQLDITEGSCQYSLVTSRERELCTSWVNTEIGIGVFTKEE